MCLIINIITRQYIVERKINVNDLHLSNKYNLLCIAILI